MKSKKTTVVLTKGAVVSSLIQEPGNYIIAKMKNEITENSLPPDQYQGSSDDIIYHKIAAGMRKGAEVMNTSVCYKKEQGILAVHVNATKSWAHKKLAVGTLCMAMPFNESSTKGRVSCHVNIHNITEKLSAHSSEFQSFAQSFLWDSYLNLTVGLFISMVDRGQLDEAVLFCPSEHMKRYDKDMLKTT